MGFSLLSTGGRVTLVCAAVLCLAAQEPAKQEPAKPDPAKDIKATGMAPRVAPADYQSQTKIGSVTLAADFVGHSVPNAQGPLTTEDFVSVELGLYGPPEARLQLSMEDFSLRINGNKKALPCEPYGRILANLKDPEWSPPEPPQPKGGKTSLGGGDKEPGSPPPVMHIPIEVQRAMAQRTQKAALPLGDRALPVAGVIFFQYRGKVKGIKSVELLYNGPAGKATLALRP